jgi:fumarate hydratase subunit alpha
MERDIMREVSYQQISETVAHLCMDASYHLPEDVIAAIKGAIEVEESPVGRDVLQQILTNAEVARTERIPLCQDCGLAVIFLELGQDVHITGGDLYSAINDGVRKGYKEGYLRKSVAVPPIWERTNTTDNTPAIIHTEIVPGDHVKITLAPKGGGSENMSALGMLKPAQGADGVADFVVRAVDQAGPNPCPPIIVGVGIGGTIEKATYLAKKSLLRPVGQPNPDDRIADFERQILARVNDLGIGPAGFGGRTTALAVNIETFGAHIASMPVAVNIQCHSARHKEAVI